MIGLRVVADGLVHVRFEERNEVPPRMARGDGVATDAEK